MIRQRKDDGEKGDISRPLPTKKWTHPKFVWLEVTFSLKDFKQEVAVKLGYNELIYICLWYNRDIVITVKLYVNQ